MVVTIVRFDLDATLPAETAREHFGESASSYLDVPGLRWKAYLRAEDGRTVGGVYWWTDRASAEAKFNPGWLAGVTEKYGAPPSIEWFDAPVIVDAIDQTIQVS